MGSSGHGSKEELSRGKLLKWTYKRNNSRWTFSFGTIAKPASIDRSSGSPMRERDSDMDFKLVAALLALSMLLVAIVEAGHAHSFQHFHGPVIGDGQEVTWKDKHGHHHHDYIAYPHYKFSYGVEDHHTGDYHGQKEYRDGKEVVGEYTVKEPGGNVRTVKYHAGKDGFFARVFNSNGNDHEGEHHR